MILYTTSAWTTASFARLRFWYAFRSVAPGALNPNGANIFKLKSVESYSVDAKSSLNLDVFVIRSDADVKLTFDELLV